MRLIESRHVKSISVSFMITETSSFFISDNDVAVAGTKGGGGGGGGHVDDDGNDNGDDFKKKQFNSCFLAPLFLKKR